MFCQNCGHKNKEGATRCVGCGSIDLTPATMLVRVHTVQGQPHCFRHPKIDDDALLSVVRGLVAYYGIYNVKAIEFDDTYMGRTTLAHLLDIELADPALLS